MNEWLYQNRCINFQQRDVENLNDSAIRDPSDTICTQMAKNYTMNL